MNTKRIICLVLSLLLCIALFAACGKTEAPAEEDGQNPVMNIVGTYMNDRCTATIEADGTNGAKVSAYWGDTARDGFQWDLTGTFDTETNRINYTDAKKASVTYTDIDTFDVNEVLFENGTGYIQVNEDGTLTWNDDQDADMAFEPLEFVNLVDEEDAQAIGEDTAESTDADAESTDADAESTDADVEEVSHDFADYTGVYGSGRCSIEIGGDQDNATISVIWGSSAAEATVWTMSGAFDPDTLRINYSDAVKANRVYDESGEVASETVEYEDGYGRIQFYGDGTMAWQDELEADQLTGMTFEKAIVG